jgi:hypothetical protein
MRNASANPFVVLQTIANDVHLRPAQERPGPDPAPKPGYGNRTGQQDKEPVDVHAGVNCLVDGFRAALVAALSGVAALADTGADTGEAPAPAASTPISGPVIVVTGQGLDATPAAPAYSTRPSTASACWQPPRAGSTMPAHDRRAPAAPPVRQPCLQSLVAGHHLARAGRHATSRTPVLL